jgi:seryl-tRNA synthetase
LRSATAAADEAAAAGEAGGQSGLYAKYQRAEEEARAAREEQAATEATLSQVLLEIDGKVPRILAQQQALHALRDEHEETSAKLAAAMHAGEAASERAAALQRMLDARDAQVKSLDLEVGDLSQQLQTVLFEQPPRPPSALPASASRPPPRRRAATRAAAAARPTRRRA